MAIFLQGSLENVADMAPYKIPAYGIVKDIENGDCKFSTNNEKIALKKT